MNRRDRLVWGLVGALSFLVLAQGYELAAGLRVGFGVKFAVAALVGAVGVGAVPVIDRRLGPNESA